MALKQDLGQWRSFIRTHRRQMAGVWKWWWWNYLQNGNSFLF